MLYQSWRTKGLSAQEWEHPPDVINQFSINPILCLGETDWLHASVTLSNPRVSIREKKPWNIFLGMVSDARHEIFIIWEQSHNRGGGSMRGFDLQKLRRLNQVDRFLPPVVTHTPTSTLVFSDEWHNAICHLSLLTYSYKLISASADLQFYGPVYYI